MESGLYKYIDDSIPNGGHITIKVSETEKSYIFELVENTCGYDPWRITSLFKNSNKAIIKKENRKHAVRTYDDFLVIYPYRDGIPYLFEHIGRKREVQKMKDALEKCV